MTSCNYGSVLVGLAALLGIAANAGCGSDNNTGSGAQTAGAGGAAAGAVGAGTAGTSGGGAGGGVAFAGAGGESTAAAGVSGGGAANGGAGGSMTAGAGGSTAGAGGAVAGAGAGGASAGAGGHSAGAGGAAAGSTGSAGAGGSAVTFAAVSAIITASCTTAGCHDGSNAHINYKTNLYSVLTTPLPTGTDHCVGSTLVVPSNTAGSFLLTAIKTGGACQKGGGTIGRMPEGCSAAANAAKPCLSAAQIQTITDWITAGAPM